MQRDLMAVNRRHRHEPNLRKICDVVMALADFKILGHRALRLRIFWSWGHGMRLETPNEKELSRRWRQRALLRSLISKSSKSYSSERPAVGWSDWLGLLTNVYSQFVEQQFQLFQR